MRMPFTTEQFLEVFRRYNEAVWPAQWALYALALIALALALRGSRRAGRAVSGILAVLWLWMGLVYHLAYFRPINPAAALFALLFVAEAVLFAWIGAWQGRLSLYVGRQAVTVLALLLVVYALVLYPALGHALGHRYPAAPTFGLPCPTTIFTIGILLMARPSPPRSLLVVPLLWVVVATSAAMQLGMREDFGLTVAGVVAALVLLLNARPRHRAALQST